MDFGFTPFELGDGASADGSLQPLEWGGLCARLSAERDLRRALAEQAQRTGVGSFAPALSVAWRGPWPDAASVNRDGLANGKPATGMGCGAGDEGRTDLGGQE
jgi:hypothetical protein